MKTLEVKRDELTETRIAEEDDPRADEGQAVLEIERFGLTANNVTYGFIGDLVGYWRYFPVTDEAWGRVPAWGLAKVTESRSDVVSPGDRFYGYLPMSTHTVIEPAASGSRVLDAAAHRADLPPIYSTYEPAPSERENETVILRPLFFTALVLDTAMAAHEPEQVIVSSASARTASAFAYFAAQREAKLIGLTSPQRVDWVKGLGIYDEVLGYDEIASLERHSSVYVDISGSSEVRDAVHGALGDDLRHSASVGGTHQDTGAFAAPEDLPGPKPELFFAPAHKPEGDPDRAWAGYCDWVGSWLRFTEKSGLSAAQETWNAVLEGKADPGEASVIVTGST